MVLRVIIVLMELMVVVVIILIMEFMVLMVIILLMVILALNGVNGGTDFCARVKFAAVAQLCNL